MSKFYIALILISLLSLGNRCKDEEAKWVPDFFLGDPTEGRIINQGGEELSCIEEDFVNYGCLHIDKINELRKVLRKKV